MTRGRGLWAAGRAETAGRPVRSADVAVRWLGGRCGAGRARRQELHILRGLAVTLARALLADPFHDLALRPIAGPTRDVYALLPPAPPPTHRPYARRARRDRRRAA